MKKMKIGIVGSGSIAQVHADALSFFPQGAEIVAIADLDTMRAKSFAERNHVPRVFETHSEMLKAAPELEVILLAVPNFLHAAIGLDALRAGKHIICEKPLATTIEDAQALMRTAKQKRRLIGYAEELCFAPKFAEAARLAKEGAIGKLYMAKQCEKHAGPYSPWFFNELQAGGGILMDMGCHAIEYVRFALGKPRCLSVFAHMSTYLHSQITKVEDHVIMILEFEGGLVGVIESSWALKGGMDSIAEIYGTDGAIYADLLHGAGLKVFSEKGYGDFPSENQGWQFPPFDWNWSNGYPHEDRHFLESFMAGQTPSESAEDGLIVLEIMLAGYHSAGIGRKVFLPFRPKGIKAPVHLWQNPRPELGEGPIV